MAIASAPPKNSAMLIAVAVALIVHAGLIAAIGIKAPEPRPNEVLQLMVVTTPGSDSTEPLQALVAAQAARAGETQALLPEVDPLTPAGSKANAEIDRPTLEPPLEPKLEPDPEAAIGEPAPEPPASADAAIEPIAEPTSKPASEPTPEQAKAELTDQPPLDQPPTPPTMTTEAKPTSKPEPLMGKPDPLDAPRLVSAADIFASRDAEMANLTARIQERSSAYAQRTRRKAISTATREYRYASYMEAWRRKVERIGNLNYPRQARELGLFGSLILHVAVRADGSIEGIRVVRSSGHDVLDQAAIRIVELSAPFAEFPPDIRRETDVLDITRTWQFQRNNQLGWDQ